MATVDVFFLVKDNQYLGKWNLILLGLRTVIIKLCPLYLSLIFPYSCWTKWNMEFWCKPTETFLKHTYPLAHTQSTFKRSKYI